MMLWPSRFAVITCTVVGLLVLAPVAMADHLVIETVQPNTVAVGDTVQVQLIIRSSETRQRVPGSTVVAYRDATIAGFTGEVEVARAVSNQNGLATLKWVQRGGSSETVIIAYSAPGEDHFESEPLSVLTVSPGPQLERSASGVQIPGLGAWVLIAVLVGIWAFIQFALIGPVQIAGEREGPGANGAGSGKRPVT